MSKPHQGEFVNDTAADMDEDAVQILLRNMRAGARRECRGHESTDGPIGNVIYCDGSCRRWQKGR